MSSSTFVFNPPSASEMTDDNEPQHTPYDMHRQVTNRMAVRSERIGRRPSMGMPDNRSTRYYAACKRARCVEDIECYRVVTGNHTVPLYPHEPVVQTKVVEDAVYYWPNTALVLETGTEYGVRPVQMGFCSWKCLSLFAAKLTRDTEHR